MTVRESFLLRVIGLILLITFSDAPPTHDGCMEWRERGTASCTNTNFIPNFDEVIIHLHMSNNEIDELRAANFSHKKFETIRLEHNSISTIDSNTFSELKELKDLSLKNNKLRFLNENMFENNTELEILLLENNPDLEFSTDNLPPSLKKVNLQHTRSFISLTTLLKLHKYSGDVCIDDNCSNTMQLNGTLRNSTTNIPEPPAKETEDVSTSYNVTHVNMDKLFSQRSDHFQNLITNIESNIYKQVSQTCNFNDSINDISDTIRKIYNHYNNTETELQKLAVKLTQVKNEMLNVKTLYIFMSVITLLIVFNLSILIHILRPFCSNTGYSRPLEEDHQTNL